MHQDAKTLTSVSLPLIAASVSAGRLLTPFERRQVQRRRLGADQSGRNFRDVLAVEILVVEHLRSRRRNAAENDKREQRQDVAAERRAVSADRFAACSLRCPSRCGRAAADAGSFQRLQFRRRARPSAQIQSVTAIVTKAAKP